MNNTTTKTGPYEMNLGEQPIAAIMAGRGLKARDLVSACNGRITHKMVTRACMGRRLTRHTQELVCAALNAAGGTTFTIAELFNYRACFRNTMARASSND